jgi:molybdate/tungstate transport system permease protein
MANWAPQSTEAATTAQSAGAWRQAAVGQALDRIAFACLWIPAGLLLSFILLPLLRMTAAQSWQSLALVGGMADVRAAIRLSVGCATLAAVLAALLGIPLAYLMAHRSGWAIRVIEAMVDLPLAVPHTVAGVALLFTFGRTGLAGRLLAPLGLSFWGTSAGIVLAMLFVSVPFMVNAARLGFSAVDVRLEKVARTLGARPLEVFCRIDLPLAWRGILTGVILTYARSISEVGAVIVLSYYPMTAPIKIYDLYLQTGLRDSSAMAVLLLAVTLSSFLVFRAFINVSGHISDNASDNAPGRPGRQ